ncbi:hypothetical protein [Ornithinimicrobium flavum]|uniref:hypothetical protein n=1 Tax=Ornithinimicrobium flavum TaxID=1288636 RepID=UPI0010700C4A|nr:hypothetical protein [Ornithinimicrobium flavum]
MRSRYLVACLLAGVATSATYGAVAGLAGSLTGGGDQAGPVLGVAFGALLGGLIIGAALGALLGGLSGLVATAVARGTTDPRAAAVRVGGTVLVTWLLALLALSGVSGSVLGGGSSWDLPGGERWVAVVVPSVLAAVVSGWAARSVADLRDPA